VDGLDGLVARPIPALVPVRDERGALRVLIASLAPGGAERIVLEWLAAEAARGRAIELAVLHERRNALPVPQAIPVRVRGREDARFFLERLARDWGNAPAPVATHLIGDDLLAILWRAGLRTVPTVHNSREGWRNEARKWTPEHVPMAIACAQSVRRELLEDGCVVPVTTIRHRPCVGAAAFDRGVRATVRAELGIAPGTFLVGAIGALKPQKDHPRAVRVLARLCRRRDAALVILGGALDRAGLGELDRVIETALASGVAARLRLPGFVPAIEPYLAACDAVLNVSRFEGLSIGAQEALAAGLPVIATDVGGQREIAHPALDLVAPGASAASLAGRLARLPVRATLERRAFATAPRIWSLAAAWRAYRGPACDTLFVTANLNAGGAQRSLVNLATTIARRHSFAIAVCGETTHEAYYRALRGAGVDVFRPAADADPFAVAESLLARARLCAARNLCFWNADPRVKMLLAKFAPSGLRIIDVSPGGYAFEELDEARGFADGIAFSGDDYYARLDTLVLKYHARDFPRCRRVAVIPNGVAAREPARSAGGRGKFVVHGRIAPSKRLETVIEAFARVCASHPDAQLDIVGPVEERHARYAAGLLAQARSLRVRFLGPGFDLAHLGQPFDAAIVLGTQQGSPNAVLEAMAAGLAVIANDSGGTRELVVHGETGWLLDEDADAAGVARAMEEALANPARTRERGHRGRERVRLDFTLDAMARRYLEVLGAESAAGREKMHAWNSVSVPVAPRVLPCVPSPATGDP
jgi:glycosyltransferase involved in cell wall biosynthesis